MKVRNWNKLGLMWVAGQLLVGRCQGEPIDLLMAPTLRTIPHEDGPAFISALGDRAAVAGDYVYVADGYAGLAVYKLGHNESVELVGSYETGQYTSGVRLAGERAYVWDAVNGRVGFDIREPTALRKLSRDETANAIMAEANSTRPVAGNYVVAFVDNKIYIARSDLGVAVIETRSPGDFPPPPLNSITVRSATGIGSMKIQWNEVRAPVISKPEADAGVPASQDDGSLAAVLVQPTVEPVAPQLTLTASLEEGALKLQISGPRGQVIRLQRSFSMAGAWEDWRTITLEEVPTEVSEAEPSGADHVFYRVVAP